MEPRPAAVATDEPGAGAVAEWVASGANAHGLVPAPPAPPARSGPDATS
jgi:hypothetical protein